MVSGRASERTFFGVSALLFAASTAATIVWCVSVPAMGEMPMCGGRMISMAWMRMPGQTWPGAAASFLVMWVAMMLPSLVPTDFAGEWPACCGVKRAPGVFIRYQPPRAMRSSTVGKRLEFDA
jgi:hypothetical protein